MIPSASTPSPAAELHRPQVFATVVVLTATIAALAPAGAAGSELSRWSVAVLVGVIAVLGIPHGAVDHLVAERLVADPVGRFARWSFSLRYIAAMAAYAVVWLVAPSLALVIFLLSSVHHFGQSDLAYLRLVGHLQLAVQWSRGVFLIGVPLVGHLEAVGPVIESLGGGQPATWPWLAEYWQIWVVVLVGQHVLVGGVAAWHRDNLPAVRREALTVVILTVLFLRTDPLLGFAVYFGLWHSMAHLLVLMNALGPPGSSDRALRVRDFFRLAAPRSLVAVTAAAVLVGFAQFVGRGDLLLPVVFVMVSLLTLPHMVVVEQMWRSSRSCRTVSV
jgi:Brp/Blh family beta-carotene 15,15'-monooxygenase